MKPRGTSWMPSAAPTSTRPDRDNSRRSSLTYLKASSRTPPTYTYRDSFPSSPNVYDNFSPIPTTRLCLAHPSILGHMGWQRA
jgi:hypothetical protein